MRYLNYLLCLLTLSFLFSACEPLDFDDEDQDIEIIENYQTYQYEIPIIFHVIYNQSNDPTQYVAQSRISAILDEVNKNFSGKNGGVDMKLKFELARYKIDGTPLEEIGVDRIHETNYPVSTEELMEKDTYIDYLWDPNNYVNVFLYNFKDDGYLGISHMPYIPTTYKDKIDGLIDLDYTSLEKENLNFTYCVSLNSEQIFAQSTSTTYNSNDIVVTLTHELGHYFGLHHVFFEGDDDTEDLSTDPDYCDDTQIYIRSDYTDYCESLYKSGIEVTYLDLIKRYDLSGKEFTSDNYLDYGCSLSNSFSQDQYDRVRTVLNYGLLIPGPKAYDAASTKATTREGVIENLPKVIMK